MSGAGGRDARCWPHSCLVKIIFVNLLLNHHQGANEFDTHACHEPMTDISWKPIFPALHGFIKLPFEPIEHENESNSQQLPLELSDEFYAFESYGTGEQSWLRGYVIKQSNDKESAQEHLCIGIFPRAHCQVRANVKGSVDLDVSDQLQSARVSPSLEYGFGVSSRAELALLA